MAIYNYQDITDELVNNSIIKKSEVYSYKNDMLEQFYELAFQFCQMNIQEKWTDYLLEPARFYFINNSEIDAYAEPPINGYYVIGMSKGIVEKLYNFFCEHDLIDDVRFSDYHELNKILVADHQISVGYTMVQTAIQFTYYHELGHLIQFANQINPPKRLSERYVIGRNNYDEVSHAAEYDADLHGALMAANHLHAFYLHNLLPAHRTQKTFEKLLIIQMVGIFCYTMILWETYNEEIYYEETTHPHSAIRTLYITTAMLNLCQKWFPSINRLFIIEEVFRILAIYYEANGMPGYIYNFRAQITQEHANITQYMSKIWHKAKSIGYLASNTEHVK